MTIRCAICGEQLIGRPAGCAKHGIAGPISYTKPKENKTMNYLEAVRELVNNPKAVAITFPSNNDPRGFRRIELETRRLPVGTYTNLVFPATETKRRQNVVATSPEFLLREDFTVIYKEEKLYTADALQQAGSRAFDTGYKHGYNTATVHAERQAFKKFKEAMKELLGD